MKVLIVDDNKQIISILEAYSKKEGYQTVIAVDGQEALDVFQRERPDIILLDVMMPKIDGFEVCRVIRKTSNVPIIMITARGEDFEKIMGLEIGAADYIVKPFDIQRVERTLRRIAASGENVTSSDNTGKVKSSPGRKMMIRGRESTNFIDIDEIVMVERQGKSTIIHTIRDEYNTSMGLGDIEEKLTDSKFIRSHKSFIINMDYVSRIEPYGRWTYIVKFNGKDYDALITSSKYDEIKKIYG